LGRKYDQQKKQDIYSHKQKFKTYLDGIAVELKMKDMLQRKPDRHQERR
jgi:hypothetical protein